MCKYSSAALLILCVGCNVVFNSGPQIPGSGTISVEKREVGDFSAVEFGGAGILTYGVSETAQCEIEIDDNLQKNIETSVVDGVLKIKSVGNIKPTSELRIRLSSHALNGCSIAGAAKFTGIDINSDAFDLDIAGSGKATLSGSAKNLKISIAGSGEVDTKALSTNDVNVSIAGSGNVDVNAVEKLDVSISGSGKVVYTGEPTVTQSVSGSGKIQKAE